MIVIVATIINIIYVSLLALLLVIFIVRLFKKFPGMDILDISEYLGGSLFKKLLGILFISYFLVSSSISATSAQHDLTRTQQTVAKEQNKITDLRQEIGELTSTSRLNKIAREKGLTLTNKNIRTIR